MSVTNKTFNPSSSAVQRHLKRLRNPWLFGIYLLVKLPAAFFMGIRVKELTPERAEVTIPFKWLTQNPFRSVYFAAQMAAAEFSTGVLATTAIQGDYKISMLVVGVEATFLKKATSKITFICEEGDKIIEAVEKAIQTGEGVPVAVTTVGVQKTGEEVAKMTFTWSFKKK